MNDDLINDDLDGRLGALFGGTELDLVPRSGATTTVLTRVRRARRRRRAIQVAAPMLTAAVVAGVILAAPAGRELGAATPPAGSPTGTTTRPTVPPDEGELEMKGTAVGALRLGMTAAEAEATGLLDRSSATPDYENPDCIRYSGQKGVELVAVGSLGVADIQVNPFIHTPQGVSVGDRYQELHDAYPAAVPATPDRRDSYRVPVPGVVGGWYQFRLESPTSGDPAPNGQTRIAGLSLRTDDHSCD